MNVQSPEIIREKADLTAYRMAKMLGVSQRNYADIISGKIKIPSGRTITNLIIIAVKYANMSEAHAVKLICKDFGISAETIEERYGMNKKIKNR